MDLPDLRIVKFLKEHHVLTLATCVGNKPWCSNCFYIFLENEVGFVFTSGFDTRHIQEALANTHVSGSVVLESSILGKIQGVQFEGKLRILDTTLSNKAKIAYLKRFPMTAMMNSHLWFLEVTYLKLTDNRIGFDRRLDWKKN